MEIKGEYKIAAPREKVFAALNDPAVLQACIPGCESLEKTSRHRDERQGAPAHRPGERQLSAARSRCPTSIRRTATRSPAKGRAASPASPRAAPWSTLREDGGATVLTYNVDAQVGGKIAQVGARLIDGTAKKLADEFFGKFAGHGRRAAAGGGGGTVDGSRAPSAVPAPSPAPSAAAQRGYKHWMVIGVGAAVLILSS